MSKFVFLVLAIVLVLGSQADAGYGQGHGGTLGTQGQINVGGQDVSQGGQSGYGQVAQVPQSNGASNTKRP